MKKIAVVLILCILAVAIGYVVHQTHSSTEFQLGESGIANNIAFVVIDYEFSESYISEYGRIEYPEEGAKFLWLYVKAANLGEVAQRIPDDWDVDILYRGTTIYYDYARPKGRKMIYFTEEQRFTMIMPAQKKERCTPKGGRYTPMLARKDGSHTKYLRTFTYQKLKYVWISLQRQVKSLVKKL
jgi:hypothetical protein